MSPGQRNRPAGEPGGPKVIAATCTNDTPSVAASQPQHRPHPDRCEHLRLRSRYCRSCVRSQRRVSAELSALCRRERDVQYLNNSFYGLTADELRRHANALAAEWSIDEIEATLAIARRSA